MANNSAWLDLDPAVATAMQRSRIGTSNIAPDIPLVPKNLNSLGSYTAPGEVHSATVPGIVSPDDLKALVLADPGYQAFKAGSDLTISNAAAARRAALRSLVTNYGGLAGLQDTYGDVDQATLDLAGKNQFSQQAQLQRNYDQGVEAFKKALSARGALQSGDLQYGLDQADQQKGQLQYDESNQFMNAAQKAINDYINTEAQQKIAEAQAIWAATNNVASWYTPPERTVWYRDPDTQELYQAQGAIPAPSASPQETQSLFDYRTKQGIWSGF